MRIGHVVEGLDPARGGPPVVAVRLAAAQAALGHAVSIVHYELPHRSAAIDAAIAAVPGFDAVRRRGIVGFDRAERLTGRRAKAFLASHVGEFDVLHLHGLWEPMLLHASRAARRAGVRYAVVPHGMLHGWSMAQSRWKKRVALLAGFGTMIRRAAFLHTLNTDETAEVRARGFRTACVEVPNGVFVEELDAAPPAGGFRVAFPVVGERPYVLFLSRLHYKKGLDHLVAAFAQVAAERGDVMLVIAGPDGGAEADCRADVQRRGLTGRVVFTGPLWGEAKMAALVDAAVFCLPSRQEGFSMAITEALGVGTPAVVSDACNFPEVAQAGAGSVVPLEPAAVAAALRRWLDDPQAARAAGAAGAALVRERFTWPKIAERCVTAYRDAGVPA